jgi:uncharacterized protein YabE (DUF348 family)
MGRTPKKRASPTAGSGISGPAVDVPDGWAGWFAPVPGTTDNGTQVTFLDTLRRAKPSAARRSKHLAAADDSTGGRRRVPPVVLRVGAAAAVVAVVAGCVVFARAGRTIAVTLDVDGQTTRVSTHADSVEELLDEQDVAVGERDVIAPDAETSLRDGDDVVVRHAHQVVVLSDGVESAVWTTALDADEALATLASRGEDVRLVASRSDGAGRPDLSMVLGSGPVDVVVDGHSFEADGSAGLAEVLADLGVSIAEPDRVHVVRAEDGRLTVVVQRVVEREEAVTSALPFATAVQQSADLYVGQTRTVVAGVPGELTTFFAVVHVDGVEESRRMVRETVTRAPVDAVVHEGTAARPTPDEEVVVGDGVVVGDVWAALAQCESGGNPTAVSSNGLYYGLYQFSLGTWEAVGGTGLPTDASAAEQTQRAQALQARSGWGQWPACARSLGLL